MSTADGRGGPGSNQHATKPPQAPRDATGGTSATAGTAVATADPLAEPSHVAAARDRHDPEPQQRYEGFVAEVGYDLEELEDAQSTWEGRVEYAKATREALVDDLDEHSTSDTGKAAVLSALDDVHSEMDDERHVRARLLEAGQYRTGTVDRAVDAVNARKAELGARAEVAERHDEVAERIMRASRARGAASDAAFRTAEQTLKAEGGDRRTVVRDVTEALSGDMHDSDDRLRDMAGRVNELRLSSGRNGRDWPIV